MLLWKKRKMWKKRKIISTATYHKLDKSVDGYKVQDENVMRAD
jgi:hypothetical protein